mgnify:CR=1 FL=1
MTSNAIIAEATNGCNLTTLQLTGTINFASDINALVPATYSDTERNDILKSSDGYKITSEWTQAVALGAGKASGYCLAYKPKDLGGYCHAILANATTAN